MSVVYADQDGTARLVVGGAAGRFDDADPGAAVTSGLTSMGVEEAEITEQDAGTPTGGAMRCGPVVPW
ncbi:hypothetical protein ACGFXC_10260 [Streptomyces sp. NPDC048507]|uniref:hypothetical protein n=1 Tax=Streptomyces sp. NPDC048507 TaxID=3365560 RepID=UPI00371AAAFA